MSPAANSQCADTSDGLHQVLHVLSGLQQRLLPKSLLPLQGSTQMFGSLFLTVFFYSLGVRALFSTGYVMAP